MMESAKAWAIKCGWEPFTAPSLEDLLPELSCEEQVRLQSRLRERERIRKRWKHPPLPSEYSEVDRDTTIIPYVRHALRHYNDKHPPLMEESVRFRGKVWYHVNFWARSRSSNKIKRFFAEVHYKKPSTSSSVCSDLQFPVPIPIVEVCTIIEEPLARYRRSCAFCRGNLDILHPWVPGSLFVGTTRTGWNNNSSRACAFHGLGCHSLAPRVQPPPTVQRNWTFNFWPCQYRPGQEIYYSRYRKNIHS